MVYTKAEQAANRAKWVAALRSGEYRQGQEVLRTENDEFCCLGVACELAVDAGIIPPPSWDDGYGFLYDVADTELPEKVRDWLGLHDTYGALSAVVDYDDDFATADTLIALNDVAGWTFQQIADVVEAGDVMLAGDDGV